MCTLCGNLVNNSRCNNAVSVAKIEPGQVSCSQVLDHPGDAMEDYNSDKDNGENYDGQRSWVTGVKRTERVVAEIRVGEILNEVVDRAVEIGMRGQEPPRGILKNNNSERDNVENSDVVQGCLDIEQFEMIKTVGKGE